MALSNTAPALLRVPGQEMKFGKVLKSSVRISAPNVVSMRIAKGFGKKMKKVPERMTELIKVPIENIWTGPVNTEVGLAKPDSISVVITNVDQIVPDLWKKYQEMKRQTEISVVKMNQWKVKAEKLESENKELRDKVMEANKLG
jgi:ornithine carbamoyltransferase